MKIIRTLDEMYNTLEELKARNLVRGAEASSRNLDFWTLPKDRKLVDDIVYLEEQVEQIEKPIKLDNLGEDKK